MASTQEWEDGDMRTEDPISQKSLDRVDMMPNMPSPYAMKDWRHHAQRYDSFVFDFDAKGDFLPLIWWDKQHKNFDRDTFGLYSYVGAKRGWREDRHEGINCIGTVLGSTLSGIDKSAQNGHDWVLMCESYFNKDKALNLFLNGTSGKTGGSFWYELYPHLLMTGLHHYYPNTGNIGEELAIAADRWRDASIRMTDGNDTPNYDWTAFDFSEMKPVFNGRHREPEAAAAVAWLEYMAFAMTGKDEYLETARWGMDFLERHESNAFYEVLLPFGAYTAARMNAEQGTSYDVHKLLSWCFDGDSVSRPGWGIIADRWGDVDCHGLCGSVIDWGQYVLNVDKTDMDRNIRERGGYAFTMNTFALAAALVPIVRYDPRYARALGKWMLNAANNARLFYPDTHDRMHQSCAFWTGDPESLIAYEGLRKEWDGRKPYATGDPIRFSWGSIDRGLYSSSHVGVFGGIVSTTNVEGILQLDCLKSDYHRNDAFPTYLIYNPHPAERIVGLPSVTKDQTIYDTVHKTLAEPSGAGPAQLVVPADSAAVAVILPRNGKILRKHNTMKCNDVVFDYMVEDPERS